VQRRIPILLTILFIWLNNLDFYLTMNKNLEYIAKLCRVATEKAWLGHKDDALNYFSLATEYAKEPESFLLIMGEVFKTSLVESKYMAYFLLYKSLDVSEYPLATYKAYLNHKEYGNIIKYLIEKQPSPIYHYLLDTCQVLEEKLSIALLFSRFALFISDPDPGIIVEQFKSITNQMKSA
jgi:hypothetical protein